MLELLKKEIDQSIFWQFDDFENKICRLKENHKYPEAISWCEAFCDLENEVFKSPVKKRKGIFADDSTILIHMTFKHNINRVRELKQELETILDSIMTPDYGIELEKKRA